MRLQLTTSWVDCVGIKAQHLPSLQAAQHAQQRPLPTCRFCDCIEKAYDVRTAAHRQLRYTRGVHQPDGWVTGMQQQEALAFASHGDPHISKIKGVCVNWSSSKGDNLVRRTLMLGLTELVQI